MTRLRKALATKRRKASVIVALLALIPATALAYFATHGTSAALILPGGTTTGAPPAALWSINVDPITGTPLSPGSGSETLANVLVSNYSQVTQYGASDGLTASVTTEANGDAESCGNVVDCSQSGVAATDIPGCLASWFHVAITGQSATIQTVPTGLELNGGTVTLTMPADASVDQSACESQTIAVTLNYSS